MKIRTDQPSGNVAAIPQEARRQVHRAKSGLLFALVLIVYVALPTKDYYWDGISFAQNIEDASRLNASLLHPNHLLYTPAGYILFSGLKFSGIPIRSLRVLQIANALTAVATAMVLFKVLLAFTTSAQKGIVLTLLFAFSATWWKFSTDANAYIVSVFFIVSCFYFLLPDRRSRPFLVAALHSAAMLFHELSVLFFPVAVLGLIQQYPAQPLRQRLKVVAQYAATAFCGTFAIYFGAFWSRQQSTDLPAFAGWITSHAPGADFTFDLWRNLSLGVRGTLQLLLAGKAMRIFERNAITAMLTVGLSAMLLLLLWRVFIRSRPKGLDLPTPELRRVVTLSVLWIATYSVFLLFWEPVNTFYRLFYLPAIILLLAAGWMAVEKRTGRMYGDCVALLVAALAIFNLAFFMIPRARAENNPRVEFALRMRPLWKPGTTIHYTDFVGNIDDWTVRYFNPQTNWRLLEGRLPHPESCTDVEKQPSLWLDTTALNALEHDAKLKAELAEETKLEPLYRAGGGYNIWFAEAKPARCSLAPES